MRAMISRTSYGLRMSALTMPEISAGAGRGASPTAAGRTRSHHHRNLRNAFGGHPGLIEENAPEMLAIGEDFGLEREKRAPGIDEVDTRQAVLERHLLRAYMFLDGDRIVGAAFDRG